MKNISILLVFLVLVATCKNKPVVENIQVTTAANNDTLNADTTSIDTVAAETNPPVSVDELFADFIYSYSTNRAFQIERTRFPLRRYFSGNETTPLKRNDWKFDRLYYKAEMHLLVFDGEKALDDFDASVADTVTVEYLKFEKQSVKQYVFVKDSGKWELTRLNYFALSKHEDADFLTFYGNFANDSAFQRKHVDEYVDFITYDEDNDNEEIEGVIDIDQWYAFHPEMPAGNVFCLNYSQKFRNPAIRVISVRGNSNSWASMFKFRKKDGLWKLVKFMN